MGLFLKLGLSHMDMQGRNQEVYTENVYVEFYLSYALSGLFQTIVYLPVNMSSITCSYSFYCVGECGGVTDNMK